MNTVTVDWDIISRFAEYCGCRDIYPRATLAPEQSGSPNSAFIAFCEADDEDPQEAWEILNAQDWSEWDEPQGMSAAQLKEFNRRLSQFDGEASREQISEVFRLVMVPSVQPA
jgi:hypothetical protein